MKKKYKLHHKEEITWSLYRLAVPGGWLYWGALNDAGGRALQFVPDPNVEIEE
jgi:hypothetical protein